MPPKRPLLKIAGTQRSIQITDDDSRTLIDPVTGVAFHSGSGALAETRHVYLNNSGVAARLASGNATCVLEIGLGTGMGMLLSVDDAACGGAELEYHALEQDWLPVEVLRQLELQAGLTTPELCDSYLAWREKYGSTPPRGSYRWQYNPDTRVSIHHHDARQFRFAESVSFDAIYFDPFAPSVNPDLWTPDFLGRMHGLLRSGGHLVTYCVNRRVKDALQACGFEIKSLRGPVGGKREVMRATRRN